MSTNYLVVFRPLDSYAFSGESAILQKGDMFTDGLTYAKKRAGNDVKSDPFPPQTTVLGAVRYLLLNRAGLLNVKNQAVKDLIGEHSYQVDQNETQMGIIQGISPVCVHAIRDGHPVLLVPGPLDAADKNGANGIHWNGERLEGYNAKDPPPENFVVVPYEKSPQPVAALERIPQNELMVEIEQANVRYQPEQRLARGEGDFRTQHRCTFARRLGFSQFAFAVIVTLDEKTPKPHQAMLSMGARNSNFHATMQPVEMAFDTLFQQEENATRLYLPSASFLPEDWNSKAKRAILYPEHVRCCTTDYMGKGIRLKLSDMRYALACKGALFFFDSSEACGAFQTDLNGMRSYALAGFNHALRY